MSEILIGLIAGTAGFVLAWALHGFKAQAAVAAVEAERLPRSVKSEEIAGMQFHQQSTMLEQR